MRITLLNEHLIAIKYIPGKLGTQAAASWWARQISVDNKKKTAPVSNQGVWSNQETSSKNYTIEEEKVLSFQFLQQVNSEDIVQKDYIYLLQKIT